LGARRQALARSSITSSMPRRQSWNSKVWKSSGWNLSIAKDAEACGCALGERKTRIAPHVQCKCRICPKVADERSPFHWWMTESKPRASARSGQRFSAKGDRMSSTVIALLNACAETPGMPPFPPFDDALADGSEHPPEQSECTPTDLAELGQEPGLEGPTPNVDERGSPGTLLVAIAISGCTGSGPLPCYGAICGFRSKWAGRRPFWGVSFFGLE
jgi:hypothetical protein